VLLVGLPPLAAGLVAARGARWARALGACTGWLYGAFLAWQLLSAQGPAAFGQPFAFEAGLICAAFLVGAGLLTAGTPTAR